MGATTFDIAFLGHAYIDHIAFHGQRPVTVTGGSIVYASLTAARLGFRVAAVCKMAAADRHLLAEMEEAGVATFPIAAPVTSQFEVIYRSDDVEDREIRQPHAAGLIQPREMPAISARLWHLAGNAAGEFSLELMRALRARGHALALDMQAFVRQPGTTSSRVALQDVRHKKAIVAETNILKINVTESRILTGQDDPREALGTIAGWGCPEIVLTKTDGVLVWTDGATSFAPFGNPSSIGRNGRGDTAFAAYLAWRLNHSPEEALRFAAAVASIKLRQRGPFNATLDAVLAEM